MFFLNLTIGLSLLAIGILVGFYGHKQMTRRHDDERRTQMELPAFDVEMPPPLVDLSPPPEEFVTQRPAGTAKPLNKADQDFAQRLYELIDRRLDDRGLQVDMLASEMAMSHTLFYDKVRRVSGVSPATLLRHRRLESARAMLQAGEHSVSEVALMCGFSDTKYFSTIFKKHFGVPPSKI